MHILTIGLNHKSAPVNLREQLSFTPAMLCAVLNRLSQSKSPNLVENIILSTCNRMEYYTLTAHPEQARQEIIHLLSQTFQIAPSVFEPHLYHLQDEVAIGHLMRVAAGLDSMVLGEAQILGQLVTAHQTALAHSTAGTILARLFEMSIHAGKRARTETAIGLNPASVSSIAIRLAQQHLGDISQQVVLILGAGEMGHQAVKVLVNQGVKNLLIASRTKENAERLATQWHGTALTYDQLASGLIQADLVICATAAPHIVLHQNQVAQAMSARPDRRMLVIDIALPRDVETSVGDLPNVTLHNIDHLQSHIADNLATRRKEIPKVETIINQEATAFGNWYHSLGVVSTITSFRQQFEAMRQQELERTLNRLPDLNEREQKIVAELSQRLLNKFLHEPTVRLRTEAARGNGIVYTLALNELFALTKE